jgi:DNA-binding transcriptional ArsR family regulator
VGGHRAFDRGAVRAILATAWLGLVRQRDLPPPLRSPLRLQIYQIVVKHPGLTLRDLARRCGMTLGALHHHVTILENARFIDAVRAGRRRLVYPHPAPVEESPEDRVLLLEDTSRRVAMAVAENPHVSVAALIGLTGLSQRVVYYHAKRLLEGGLLSRGSFRDPRGLVATAKLYALLGATPEAPADGFTRRASGDRPASLASRFEAPGAEDNSP